MRRVTTVLGYTAAALTVVAAVLTPFVLIGAFTGGVAKLGLHIDPVFGGGAEIRSIARDRYRIAVHEMIRPRGLWPRVGPFVQLAWTPVDALPSHVSDEVDVDGDGRADALVSFDVPTDPNAPLSVDVVARTQTVRSHRTGRGADESFDTLAIRLLDRIVVRIPLGGGVAGSRHEHADIRAEVHPSRVAGIDNDDVHGHIGDAGIAAAVDRPPRSTAVRAREDVRAAKTAVGGVRDFGVRRVVRDRRHPPGMVLLGVPTDGAGGKTAAVGQIDSAARSSSRRVPASSARD